MRSEMDRSVSSTKYAGGGPVMGITTSVQSGPGCKRTAPTRRMGATVSPVNVGAGAADCAGGATCAGAGDTFVGGCAAAGGATGVGETTGAAGRGCALAVRTCSSLLKTQAS